MKGKEEEKNCIRREEGQVFIRFGSALVELKNGNTCRYVVDDGRTNKANKAKTANKSGAHGVASLH